MTRMTRANCGRCFFSGRNFHVDPDCREHSDSPTIRTIRCEVCGVDEAAELIDAACSGDPEIDDWDRMLCIECYGLGYSMLSPESIQLSQQPHLIPLYKAWIEVQRLRGIIWC